MSHSYIEGEDDLDFLKKMQKKLRGPQGVQGWEGRTPIHVQETKPTGKDVQRGDLWYQPSTKKIHLYSGEWEEIAKRGIQGLEGERGATGKDGKDSTVPGPAGKDGKDGKDADLSEMRLIADVKSREEVKSHEGKFDHTKIDPFLVGSKKISEAGMEDGMVVTYDQKADRLIYTTIKQVASKVSRLAGRGLSLPSQSGNSGKYLTTDGERSSWATVSGSGDVVGPASATDSNFAAFDTTTGKLIKDSTYNAASFAAALGADDNYVTDAEKTVIGNTSGTNTGDQSLFSTIAVSGQSNVVADSTGDTLTLIAGSNITITTNATNDSVTITGSGGGSGITRSVNSISTPTTAGSTASTDYVYFVSGTTTITQPTAVGNTNRYSIKNTGSDTVTVAFDGAETADGSSTLTLLPNVSVDLISNGTIWFIL